MAKRVGSQAAVYNAGGITLVDGAETGLFVAANGALLTSASANDNRWSYYFKNNAGNIDGIIVGAGVFHSIIFTARGDGGLLVVRDSATASGGNTIAVIDYTTALVGNMVFDVPVTTGLSFEVINNGAGLMTFTILYRQDN